MRKTRTFLSIALALTIAAGATVADASGWRNKTIELSPVGEYRSGVFDDGATEINAYCPLTKRVFSTNAANNTLDVFDLSEPSNPTFLFGIDLAPYGGGPNSVACQRGLAAVAVEADNKQAPGSVVFFRTWGSSNFVNEVTVGALPDMLTFTKNGRYIVVCDEGEPDDDYVVDPDGSVSIIDLRWGAKNATVKTADFTAYNGQEDALRAQGIRIFGPGASASQDFEPEYATTSNNSRTAYVVLQENNAMAVVDIKSATVVDIWPLGYKDHSLAKNALDASNDDGVINITNWPVRGMYLPDAIASYKTQGRTYIVTTNEGDSRDYDGFSEEERVKDVMLDPAVFTDPTLQDDENLGRLKITNTLGDADGDGYYETLYSYGGRSFSIFKTDGSLVFDSADEFEQITAIELPNDFNSTNDENDSFDNRSDDKGPEPEAVAIGKINGRFYAFIGLERVGGIMVYCIDDPYSPKFVQYITTRDFSGDAEMDTAGNLAPEGITFVPKHKSPSRRPLVIVSYEVSGSMGVFGVNTVSANAVVAQEADGDAVAGNDSRFGLAQNEPNPFNPSTVISYQVPAETNVSLRVFDAKGREVAELVNGFQSAGVHSVTFDASALASGVYFYRMQAGDFVQTRKLTLLK